MRGCVPASCAGHSWGVGAIICLKDLTNQIKIGRLTDALGHDFQLNDAYMRAVELLARIAMRPKPNPPTRICLNALFAVRLRAVLRP